MKSEKYTYITIQRDGEGSYIQQPLELIVENKCKKFFVCDVVGIREEQGWWQGKFGTVVNQWKWEYVPEGHILNDSSVVKFS